MSGLVQGVGMRPFVYRLARELDLAGRVSNGPEGVIIEAEGDAQALAAFEIRLKRDCPPPADIVDCIVQPIPAIGDQGFRVEASRADGTIAPFALPDLAPCPTCLRELFDPGNRRFRYPFISCTHCGPRYSILDALPFDRERTAMAGFPLCAECLEEYSDPSDRRFHAQTTCCSSCGPTLALWDAAGRTLAHGDEALLQAVERLRRGQVLALQGLGGFQLLVDAADEEAVQRLRERKHRPHKPLALLVPDLAAACELCDVTEAETQLLTSSAAPIVLLGRRAEAGSIASGIAPGQNRLGLMLPASPLHHLLARDFGAPLVCTSGNRSDEPICIAPDEALGRLAGIADAFLVHDRPIRQPLDDSVIRIADGKPLMLRRARGYVPRPVALDTDMPPILAAGGHLKNTVAYADGRRVILSQHLGDLDTAESLDRHRTTAELLPRLFGRPPRSVVCDRHPDYASTRWAESTGLPLRRVPHHLAHALACMAEHGLKSPVLAVTWDGLGLGEDGTLWGGEFLHIAPDGHRRIASLMPLRLPGGERAIKDPRRSALSVLHALYGEETPERLPTTLKSRLEPGTLSVLLRLLQTGTQSPECSSAGRLFDAAASLLGLCRDISFEGQAAMALEAAAERGGEGDGTIYPMPLIDGEPKRLDWCPLFHALLDDRAAGVPTSVLAFRFHSSLAAAVAAIAVAESIPTVVLAGGCFQNRLLLELCAEQLRHAGLRVYWPQQIPPNDGGLALGQIAAATFSEEFLTCV
ncbi:carbamoyltransferase HypF [Methylocaldum szegediense]|uniref:carbamoyltransferase HypF n=1 Tax=Methylocaldum szegediense TaxID=73780 RepID=UPI00192E58B9|nr:carbamoyltransferase HypF [Methylocaldum szegediense]